MGQPSWGRKDGFGVGGVLGGRAGCVDMFLATQRKSNMFISQGISSVLWLLILAAVIFTAVVA